MPVLFVTGENLRQDTALEIRNQPGVFSRDSVRVLFPRAPLRPGQRDISLRQMRELASDGSSYIYSKGEDQAALALVFPGVTAVTLEALLDFFEETIQGIRHPFTWIDHEGLSHTVRSAGSRLQYRETTPGRYRVEIALTEDLS